jgi:hypothetical protein
VKQLESTIPAITRAVLDKIIDEGLWPAPVGKLDGQDVWTDQQVREALALLIAISRGCNQPGLLKSVQ